MEMRVQVVRANLRSSADTNHAPLAELPVGHRVVVTGDETNGFLPCRTMFDGEVTNGFVNSGLLRQPIKDKVDAIIEIAGAALRGWRYGDRKEGDAGSQALVDAFWTEWGHATESATNVAWSAAFISFMMHRAKLGEIHKSFAFSASHVTYFSDSKIAFLAQDQSRAYWAVRLEDHVVKLGDLVGYSRIGGECGTHHHTYDDLPGQFCSHSDVVVAIRNGVAITVGGNVSNSVSVTDVPLTPEGRVKELDHRILVMMRTF